MYQIYDENITVHETAYDTVVSVILIINLILFMITFTLTLGPATWAYMAETLPPRGLGIAAGCHFLANSVIALLPYLVLVGKGKTGSEDSFDKTISSFFFYYSFL